MKGLKAGKMFFTATLVALSAALLFHSLPARAQVLTDNFNDNVKAAMWSAFQVGGGSGQLVEANGRLEARLSSNAEWSDGMYYLRGRALDTTQDFSLKVNWHLSHASGASADAQLSFGVWPTMSDAHNTQAFMEVFTNDWSIGSGFHVGGKTNGVKFGDDHSYCLARTATEGWLYISYDAAVDRLYMSVNGYRRAPGTALGDWVFDGIVRGTWRASGLELALNGGGQFDTLTGSDAYYMGFEITSGNLIDVPPTLQATIAGLTGAYAGYNGTWPLCERDTTTYLCEMGQNERVTCAYYPGYGYFVWITQGDRATGAGAAFGVGGNASTTPENTYTYRNANTAGSDVTPFLNAKVVIEPVASTTTTQPTTTTKTVTTTTSAPTTTTTRTPTTTSGSTTTTTTLAGTVRRVKWNAAGANNGTTWADAYTSLESALQVAQSGDEIWISTGTYYPTSDHGLVADTANGEAQARLVHFELKNHVASYGGFAGTEVLRSQRDWKSHVVTLSGDIGVAGDNSDNCYHVFNHGYGLNLDATAVLDGVTICDGNANGSVEMNGGGMNNYSCSPTIANCTFFGNAASNYGGGMENDISSPILTNCVFNGNAGACDSGGMDNNGSSPILLNCTFSGNMGGFNAGGMLNNFSTPALTNCIFYGNTTSGVGGGMWNLTSSPTLTNCTFCRNTAGYGGGGICNTYSPSSPSIRNCIFWGNSAPTGCEVFNAPGSVPAFDNCDLSGSGGSGNWQPEVGADGGGNIDANPVFVDAVSGDLRLTGGSPCIDAADGLFAPLADKDGLGHYDAPNTPNTGRGTPNYADIGAYEFGGTTTPTFPLCLMGDQWQLVSLPMTPTSTGPASVFGTGMVSCYAWDATDKRYVVPTSIQAKTGYWVLVNATADLTIPGTAAADSHVGLAAGWNLVGPSVATTTTPGGIMAIYSWDGARYIAPTQCDTGKGYWVAATQAGTIW